jgi:hypothetical protein
MANLNPHKQGVDAGHVARALYLRWPNLPHGGGRGLYLQRWALSRRK